MTGRLKVGPCVFLQHVKHCFHQQFSDLLPQLLSKKQGWKTYPQQTKIYVNSTQTAVCRMATFQGPERQHSQAADDSWSLASVLEIEEARSKVVQQEKGPRKYCSECSYTKRRHTTTHCVTCRKPICGEHQIKYSSECMTNFLKRKKWTWTLIKIENVYVFYFLLSLIMCSNFLYLCSFIVL